MKTNPFTTITTALVAVLLTPAFAIEAPADDTPPPATLAPPPPALNKTQPEEAQPKAQPKAQPEAQPEAQPAAMAEAAFLGVVSTEVPEVLAEHLGLKAGEGIVVQALMPDGPAAKAGVAVHDIITRVAGQPVASSKDLTKQVAAHKPDETIHLDLIHKGKPAGIDVTLGTRPAGMAAIDPRPLDQLNLEGIPKNLADRVRGMIEGNLGGMELKIEDGAIEMPARPQMEEAMREMKKRMEKAMQGLNAPGAPGVPKIEIQQGAAIHLMDEHGSIEVKSNEGGKEVTIRDKDNKIIWNGPWDTDQDKAAAPDDIRQRMDRLNLDSKFDGNGLRLQFRGGIDLPPPPAEDDGE